MKKYVKTLYLNNLKGVIITYIVTIKTSSIVKQIEYIVEKLNDLLILNEEVVYAYDKASTKMVNEHNRSYSRDRIQERTKFVELLKKELNKFEEKDENLIAIKRRFHMVRTNFRKYFKIENDPGFYVKVYEIDVLSLNKYDELLSQINLPLSLCRLLLKHRDIIQAGIHAMERRESVINAS